MDDKSKFEGPVRFTKAELDESLLDRDLVFHYSRERRLAKASAELRDFNEAGPQKGGFLRRRRGNPFHLVLLMTIIVFSLGIFFISGAKGNKRALTLGGNVISVSAERLKAGDEGAIFLTIKKIAPSQAYTGAVDVAVTFAEKAEGKALPVEARRIIFHAKAREEIILTIPFDAPVLAVVLQSEDGQSVLFKVKVK
ncbi:MAG: hypothetical protein LBG90_00840 [Spirochaetaceae bacterium]|jgi:hypothetical protein|nr:hypothetical protein [Spirochaetaceae bacterium]